MTKIDLQQIGFTDSTSTLINSNSAEIEAKSDTFLSRNGATPNEMLADLDMNGNSILNLPSPTSVTEPLRLQDLVNFTGGTLTVQDPYNDTSSVVGNTGAFWFTGSSAAKVHKFNRLLVGEATVGGRSAPPSPRDWLETLVEGTTQNSQLTTVNTIGLIGSTGAARASDFFTWSGASNGQGTIGVAGYGINDDSHNQSVWGGYFQGNRNSGAGPTYGVEIQCANFGATTLQDPYNTSPTGWTYTALIGAGAGYPYSTQAIPDNRIPNNTGAAIGIVNNGSRFRKGIVFDQIGLEAAIGQGGAGVALETATGQSWRVLSATNTTQIEMYGSTTGFSIKGPTASQLNIFGTDATSYTQIIYNGSGRVFQTGVGNASEAGIGVANKYFIYDATGGLVRLSLDSTGLLNLVGTMQMDALRIDQTPTAVGTGAKTISNAADSSTNLGHYISVNLNGTTYFIPCGTVALT